MQQSITENAKVQLSYTNIRSPIDGRTGNNTVKVGNLATVNQELVTIAQLQPVYVTFTVPAVHLPTIKQHLGADKLAVVATPQDEDKKSADGQLTFVDNLVDAATDTIKLKATFPNADHRLWPGQFARVSLRLTTLSGATVVPSQAVQTGQNGQFVFVVKQDATVEQRPITVAQRMGDDVVIGKGLNPGKRSSPKVSCGWNRARACRRAIRTATFKAAATVAVVVDAVEARADAGAGRVKSRRSLFRGTGTPA